MDPRVFRSAPYSTCLDRSDVVDPRYTTVDPLSLYDESMDRDRYMHHGDPRVDEYHLSAQPYTDLSRALGQNFDDLVRTYVLNGAQAYPKPP